MKPSTRRSRGSLKAARFAAWTIALLALTAADAQAQMSMGSFHGYLTGHIGSVLGGDVTGAKTQGGASVAVQEATGWGAEFDFGRATDVEVDALRLGLTSYMVNMAYI